MLLLRHASAGQRLMSPSIDRFRQLDRQGRSEAQQLVWMLAEHEIERVVTSPLARCVETVVPTAASLRLAVESRVELAPEAPLEATLLLLDELPDETLVCTHREVIQRLFADEVTCEKGGTWVLERNRPLWSPTAYLPPPASADALPRTALSR